MTGIGAWIDRSGERQTYFSGANYGQKLCACALEEPTDNSTTKSNNCFSHPFGPEKKCNCDISDTNLRHDKGYITNMVSLLHFFHFSTDLGSLIWNTQNEWKFQDFSATQILCEIYFGHLEASKTAICTI